MARIVKLILADEARGTGSGINPHRTVWRLYTLDGYLVAYTDPCGVRHADGTFQPTSWARDLDKGE